MLCLTGSVISKGVSGLKSPASLCSCFSVSLFLSRFSLLSSPRRGRNREYLGLTVVFETDAWWTGKGPGEARGLRGEALMGFGAAHFLAHGCRLTSQARG